MPRGRPKIYDKIQRTVALVLELPNGERVTWDNIPISCAECHGTYITFNGMAKRKTGEVQNLKCEKCKSQFKIHTSLHFQEKLELMLWDACVEAVQDGAKQKTIARKWGFSDSTMSKIVSILKEELSQIHELAPLLDEKVDASLISMDEAFITVGGKKRVIIIARDNEGKTLAFSVSERRAEEDLRAVFDAAEAQMESPARVLLSDGLNAYQGMARNLKRDIIHAIHIHKPPYTRLIVRSIKYDGHHREELTVATKTNILTRRGKREVRYVKSKKYVGPPRKRGRKKGTKIKKKKAKKRAPSPQNKKRGPKHGLSTLHKRGAKGYIKVDPYRQTIRGANTLPPELVPTFQELQAIFGRDHIVNNFSEYGISQFRRLVPFSGKQTVEGLEARLSLFFRVKNGQDFQMPPGLARRFRPRLVPRAVFLPFCTISGGSFGNLEMLIKEVAL